VEGVEERDELNELCEMLLGVVVLVDAMDGDGAGGKPKKLKSQTQRD
jgi:hypothetical protein